MIELPVGDADFTLRWRLIKIRFSKSIPRMEWRSVIRVRRGERGIWQRKVFILQIGAGMMKVTRVIRSRHAAQCAALIDALPGTTCGFGMH